MATTLAKRATTLAVLLIAASGREAWAQEGVIDHSSGFAGETDLTLNGGAAVSGISLRLTDGGGGQARTFFFTNPVSVTAFQTKFRFHQLAGSSPTADGMCFIIQGDGATALGPAGGGLGYGPDTDATAPSAADILKSICVKFDLYSNNGEGVDSTGVFVDGHAPTVANGVPDQTLVDLSTSPINLHSGHDFSVLLSYNGTTLTETITDLTTNGTFTTTYTINIPGNHVGANTGWVGFGGGTGGLTAIQDVMTWAYGVGFAPTALTATPGTEQSSLAWTVPTTGATSYIVLRSTTPGTGYSQIAKGITGTSYVDTTAAGGTTYYYVVMATTTGGNSLYSNEASCTPILPVVVANPTTGLTVSETGTTTTFTLTPTKPVTGTFTVTVTSGNSQQAAVSWNGSVPGATVAVNFNSAAPQTVMVTGEDDHIANDPQTVALTLAVTASTDANYPVGSPMQTVSVSVLEADTPGLLSGPPSGIVVDGGNAVTFTVQLNTMPVSSTNPVTAGTAVFDISNSAPQVCTVTPTQVSFNDSNWNVPVTVTITPLNDNGQNPAVFFAVTSITVTFTPNPSSTDPVYAALPPTGVTVPFVDNYAPPALPKVWGDCGLLGLELLVPVGFAWRRRLRRSR